MRLFGTVNGVIDHRERAAWITVPFDKDLRIGGPYSIQAAQVFGAGASAAQVFGAGAVKAEINAAGSVASEVHTS